ncbi:MAG: hypothetical protein HRU15_19260, partial [Planctomycetes bacterium]|nr:hypothetical protein [Planctomycetota bacterium]
IDGSAAMGQDDIDKLLNQLSGDGATEEEIVPANAAETLIAGDEPLGQQGIDDLLAQLTGEDPNSENAEGSEEDEQALSSQSDIDKLLQEMGMGGDSGGTAELLSTEQIAGIVDGQTAQEFDEEDDDDEEMISQSDIDSLVREMSQATGVPDQNEIDARVAENESDIEALLQEAAEPAATMDAVQGSIALGPQPVMQMQSAVDPAAVMAPDELRGTRYLLVAAVFLLAMCAVTMGFVVRSINDLSSELEKNRTSEIKPVDDFQENISYARRMLEADDPLEIGRGLTFVKRLKENHDKEPDKIIIISLLLADHYRATGAYSKAKVEYELMTDRQGTLYDDPQYYLDYSETLFALGEKKYDDAVTILYRLMANEQYYISELDDQGNTRDVTLITRHEKVIQEAYLMLGRIFTAQLEGGAPQMRGESS